MLYLEDFIELIEHLPDELRDRLTEMREMDLLIHSTVDDVDDKAKNFFSRTKRMRLDDREREFKKVENDYRRCFEESHDKFVLADRLHNLFTKHIRKLDQELVKFKMELEADNSGITELLEQRSLEMDDNYGPSGSAHLRSMAYAARKPDPNKSGSRKLGGGIDVVSNLMPHKASRSPSTTSLTNNHDSPLQPDARPRAYGGKNGTLGLLDSACDWEEGESITNNNLATTSTQATTTIITNQQQMGRRSSTLKATPEVPKTYDLKSMTKDMYRKRQTVAHNHGEDHLVAPFRTALPDTEPNAYDDVSFSPAITNLIHNAEFGSNFTRDGPLFPPNSGTNAAILNYASPDQPYYGSDSNFGVGSPYLGFTTDLPSNGGPHDPNATAQPSNHQHHSTSRRRSVAVATGPKRSFPARPSLSTLPPSHHNNHHPHLFDRTAAVGPTDHVTRLGEGDEDDDNTVDDNDPNEPRYCVCNQVSYGEMVACDNPGCPYEWFHYPCVAINQPPKGKWYCPECVLLVTTTNATGTDTNGSGSNHHNCPNYGFGMGGRPVLDNLR